MPKTKLKMIAYRLRGGEKILNRYNKSNRKGWKIKEAELIVRQVRQDWLHLVEGTDLKDVEKEIERLQRSLTT